MLTRTFALTILLAWQLLLLQQEGGDATDVLREKYICTCNEKVYEEYKPPIMWGYDDEHNGPKLWGRRFSECSGEHQSPVEISKKCAVRVCGPKLEWLNYKDPGTLTFCNTGRTVMLTGNWLSHRRPSLKFGQTGTFAFNNAHFHWSSDNSNGSEHVLNRKRYAMEMHAVHVLDNTTSAYGKHRRKRQERDNPEAVEDKIEVLIINVFFRVFNQMQHAMWLDPIIKDVNHIRHAGSCTEIKRMSMDSIVPIFHKNFYYYPGSYSTPPCTETVLQVISTKTASINPCQLHLFRNILDLEGHSLDSNVRPLQKLNDRFVRYMTCDAPACKRN